MDRRSLRCSFVAVLAASAAVASAASAATPVTKAEYKAMLKQANARVTRVETEAERGLQHEAPAARMKMLLLAWARTETAVGKSFQATRPPAVVASANTLLARGEILFGSQLTAAANHLPRKAAAIGAYLQRKLGSASGARMVDKALAQLKAAGYG